MKATSKALLTGLAVVTIVVSASAMGAFASNHTDSTASVSSQDTAHLRVAHLSPDAPAVDVYVDNESVLTNVSFGDASDYLTLDAGEHTVSITEAGDRDATVFETNVTLEPRSVTTVAAAGEVSEDAENEFGLRNYTDNAREPESDEAAFRVVHLSPDVGTVDVTLVAASDTNDSVGNDTGMNESTAENDTATNESTVLAEDVTFGNSTDYLSLPPGDYTVEIRQDTEDADGLVLLSANVTIEDGQAHTAWVSGYLVPLESTDAGLTVGVTQDATLTVNFPSDGAANATPTATPTGTETATETATATGNETATETGTATGNETATETGTATGNETATETETTAS